MSGPEWRSQLPVASSFPYRTRLTAGQVLGFLAFSHGWTWTFYWIAASWGRSIWEPPGTIFFYLGGAGVLLGGVVMSWATYGVDGL